MNLSDSISFAFTGRHLSPRGLSLVCDMNYVCPIPPDEMAHSKSAVPDTSYNGLSLDDIAITSSYRYCDNLHKPDIVARDFNRGVRVNSSIKKVGFDKYVNSRLSR